MLLVLVAVACAEDEPTEAPVVSVGGALPVATPPVATPPIASDPDASATSAAPIEAPVVVPEGFVTVAAMATAADGEQCPLCLWLADDPSARGRGLMQVTDLGGLDGMAFRYAGPHTGSFTMRNTVMPLSIVFFDADATYLDAFDMQPCEAEPCPSYPTPANFVVAVEVPQGGLAELGIGPGSTLELFGDGCDPAP